MIFIYKNRGVLIPVYAVLPMMIFAIIANLLKDFFEWNIEFNTNIIIGVGLLFSSMWIYLVKGDRIKVDGNWKGIFIEHHFYYINLEKWSYIIFFIGILTIISGIF